MNSLDIFIWILFAKAHFLHEKLTTNIMSLFLCTTSVNMTICFFKYDTQVYLLWFADRLFDRFSFISIIWSHKFSTVVFGPTEKRNMIKTEIIVYSRQHCIFCLNISCKSYLLKWITWFINYMYYRSQKSNINIYLLWCNHYEFDIWKYFHFIPFINSVCS